MSILNTRIQWVSVPREPKLGQWAAFYITLSPKGRFSMTRRTYEALGAPPAFQLFFDPPNSRIGLKPSALAGKNAYPVFKRQLGRRVINAYRLMVEFNLDLKHTIQFTNPDRDQDGTLVLDLRTAYIPKRVRNNRHNREKFAELRHHDRADQK